LRLGRNRQTAKQQNTQKESGQTGPVQSPLSGGWLERQAGNGALQATFHDLNLPMPSARDNWKNCRVYDAAGRAGKSAYFFSHLWQ
jgi:hypothetical protein